MYGKETNPTGVESHSIYMTAAKPYAAVDEGFIDSIMKAGADTGNAIYGLTHMTPEQKQNAATKIQTAFSATKQQTVEKLNQLGNSAMTGAKTAISTIGNVASDLGGHSVGTRINTALDMARNTAKTVGEKNGKTLAALGAGALALYGGHNLIQHVRKNAESDHAIRRNLDAQKELVRYKEQVRAETEARQKAIREMSKEEIAAAKDRERKELLNLQSLSHQADVEGRNMSMTGYNPYIKESVGEAIKKFTAKVEPTYGADEDYTDKSGNRHTRRQVTIGEKTYTQVDGGNLVPVKDEAKSTTVTDAIAGATHDRNVKRAATAISVAGPALLIGAGAVKHHMDKKKKEREEEERRRKEAEDAYNSRIDVRVRKALGGKKSDSEKGKKKKTNESAVIYESVALSRVSIPEESMGAILEDAIRVRMEYDNTHRNFGLIADEYVPAARSSPWLG